MLYIIYSSFLNAKRPAETGWAFCIFIESTKRFQYWVHKAAMRKVKSLSNEGASLPSYDSFNQSTYSCWIQNSKWSTYNVDNRERRCWNDYITATHNVSKKICWRSATLCVTNGASTEMPCRFWYDRQSVEIMVNWCRIDSMSFPGTGLVMQWAEDAEHPRRLNGFCQECACVLERKRYAYLSL